MKGNIHGNGPETALYTKYYEHDGMLRAYANRSMVLAMVFGVLALVAFGFAIYVRLQPPTVIRVDKDGNATVVGAAAHPATKAGFSLGLSAEAAAEAAPTDLEARAAVRRVPRSLPVLHTRLRGPKPGRVAQHDDRQSTGVHNEPSPRRRHRGKDQG